MAHTTACGGSDDGATFDGGAGNGNGGIGASGGIVRSDGGTSGTSGTSGGDASCQATTSRAEKAPVFMVIALDQSGSMGDNQYGTHKATRWTPVTTALKGFLGAPTSAGITASLRLFPKTDDACDNDDYAVPAIPFTALPNAAAFVLPDDADFRSTPTKAVLHGAAAEARATLLAHPNAKVVVLLITDGEPAGCSDNDIDHVAAQIAAADGGVPEFKTYVIGVGSQGNLDKVAQKGGTAPAIIVSADDPAAGQAQFTAAIEAIRAQTLSCEIAIPPAPAGETIDPAKVNVSITLGGVATQLGYDPSCAGAGWRYDDAAKPTQIVLCDATCAPAKADPTAAVDVGFGCATRLVGPN